MTLRRSATTLLVAAAVAATMLQTAPSVAAPAYGQVTRSYVIPPRATGRSISRPCIQR